MFVRTTCSSPEPARSSASPMIRRQSAACSYASSGTGEPSGGIGAVPATWTRSPATTAREKPATPSYGEWPLISLCSIRGDVVSRPVQALHQIDAWDVPFAAAGVDARRRHRRHPRRDGPCGPPRVGLEADRGARDARRGRGGSRRPRRAGRAARRNGPSPARARLRACRSRARRRSRRPGGGGSTRTRASACSASTSPLKPR